MRYLLQQFLKLESASGILLFIMTLFAIIWANSSYVHFYHQLISHSLFFVNEGLMSLFFLLVGLELKRGLMEGELSQPGQIKLPAIAALGGMIVPALIFASINYDQVETFKAWATPVATDIAFALGVLSLFGSRIPSVLKLFLLALAIFDDIGAIFIIAIYYTKTLSYLWLILAAILLIILCFLNKIGLRLLSLYLLLGIGMWFCLFFSGIHPTLAGVLLALSIPIDSKGEENALLHSLEKTLHPWVAFLIMPLFALLNAGFPLQDVTVKHFTSELVLGIVLGLFVGKQLGVFGFSWLMIHFKWAKLPAEITWLHLYGIALLCGIGFTMSLFLGTLSFVGENIYLTEVRLGVIIGSILSGFAGASVLSLAWIRSKSDPKNKENGIGKR